MTESARIREGLDINERRVDDVVEITKAIGDRLRARILQVLREDSYSVSELCRLFDMPQPGLSHHLKILHLAGLVAKRREGNSIFYRRDVDPDDQLRLALFNSVDSTPISAEVSRNAAKIHQLRHDRSNAFFTDNAHRFADQQALISEATVYVPTIVNMIEHAGVSAGPVLEIGPGDGQLLALLAKTFDEVVGIDSSATMLKKATAQVGDLANVTLRQKDFTDLPAIRRYQAVVAAMVVHHVASPQRFFHHAARVIKRGGLLVVAELCRHDHEWVTQACGDQWLGFEPKELNRWAGQAGFELLESQYLAQNNGFRIQIHSYC
ncbi:MAG: metalloregulator ArsR/SmtB family transcription factor [Pseudomonadales bacterium]|jgi:ArsR family transcriptional regulator